MNGPKCPGCGHVPHMKACTRLATSRCVITGGPGRARTFLCGTRPPCDCTVRLRQSAAPEPCTSCGAPRTWWALGPATHAYPYGVPVQLDHPGAGCPTAGPDCTHPGGWAAWRDATGQLRARPGPPRPGEHRAVPHFTACRQHTRAAQEATR